MGSNNYQFEMNGLITVRSLKRLSLLTMMVLLAGCVSTPEYRYYSLRALSGADKVAEVPQLSGVSVGIMPVQAPEWLDKENMSYSDGGYRLYQADFDRWGEPLPQIMTRVVMRNLEQISPGLDVSVGPWNRSQQPEHMISIEVLDLAVKNNVLVLEARWEVKSGLLNSARSFYDKIEQPLVDGSYESIALGSSQVIFKLTSQIVVTALLDTNA